MINLYMLFCQLLLLMKAVPLKNLKNSIIESFITYFYAPTIIILFIVSALINF